MRTRDSILHWFSSFQDWRSADDSLGQPAVVIPLDRAVVCGDDHVYDAREFKVCPNCAAEERLPLAELLARGRLTATPIAGQGSRAISALI